MNIRIEKLSKYFNNELILREIDLDLPVGKRFALIGSNGSGKSTLLRAMMGMISCEGKITFTDSYSNRISSELAKKSIAYVPQISPYFSSLVSDVVTTILYLRKIQLNDFIWYLKQFYLDYWKIASLSFQKLSGGMKQKLLISLAFASRPQVLLLDESTANLDSESRESFYRLGQSKHFSNISLVLCSHRLEEIQQLVDEVVVLDKGAIVFKGKTHEYFRKVLNKI